MSFRQLIILCWWLFSFQRWRIKAMQHFEINGMLDYYAFKKANSLTKAEYLILKEE
jgi:hypothetical protein